MTNLNSSVVESKNLISFDVHSLKNRFVISCLTFNLAVDKNADDVCVAVCSNCRNSLFNRLILMFTVIEIVFNNVCICFEVRSKLTRILLNDCFDDIVSEF